MAEEQLKKVEAESTAAPAPAPIETTKTVAEEKAVIQHPEEKVDDSKALALVESNLSLSLLIKFFIV